MGTIELSAIVVLTGIIIVFTVLAVLTFATKGYSYLIKFFKNYKKKYNTKTVQQHQSPLNKTINSNENINDEIVAVISAAIYALSYKTSKKYTIKSIKPANCNSTTSAWKLAGFLENTNNYKF